MLPRGNTLTSLETSVIFETAAGSVAVIPDCSQNNRLENPLTEPGFSLPGSIFGDPCFLKSEYLSKNSDCSVDNSRGQGRPGTFSEAHAQIEYRFESEIFQHFPMSCLFGAMAGEEVINHGLAQGLCH